MARPPYLTHRIVVFVLVDLLIAFIVIAALFQSRQQAHDRAATLVDGLAQVLEQTISAMVYRIDITLLDTVEEMESELAKGIDETSINVFLHRQIKHHPELDALRIVDETGHLRYGIGEAAGNTTSSSVADRDYFIRARDDPDSGLFVSKPVIGRISGKWSIALGRRINRPDGSFGGAVLALITLEQFQKLFRAIDIGPKGVVTLLDLDMEIVARHPEAKGRYSSTGTRITQEALTRALQKAPETGAYDVTSWLDKTARVMSYRKVDNYPGYIFVGIANDDFLGDWHKQSVMTIILMVLVVTITGIGIKKSERAEKERQRLTRALRLLSEGNLSLARAADEPALLSDICRLVVEVGGYLMAWVGFAENDEEKTVRPVAQSGYEDGYLENTRISWSSELAIGRGPTGKAIDTGKCQVNQNILTNPTLAPWREAAIKRGYTASIALPLVSHAQTIGALTIYAAESDAFGTEEIALLEELARNLVFGMETLRTRSQIKTAQTEIEYLAYHDPLTDLPNRRLLLDRLHRTLASRERTKCGGALMLIDLDNFKTLNDTFGHETGDQLLRQVAERLSNCVRKGDTVARLGGDEFVVMVENLSENPEEAAAQIKTIGEKILAALSSRYSVSEHEHHGTASVGAALFGDHQESVEELLKQVDIALYQAKAAGRNTLRFFDPELQAAVQARAAMEATLRQGIRDNQLLLYYQPQVDGAGQSVGAEALVRWHHPDRGMVSPHEFIPLAEETGLILPLGEWVLETACSQIVAWSHQPGMAHLSLAVNVSARQFRQTDFVEKVQGVLKRTGANPQRLKLELTESMLVDNVEDIIEKMSALKRAGVSFSLDDFGTGYSSLSYLKRLPLDQLKIDQSFVRDVLTDPNDAAIARTIVALAQSLGLSVMAEGVETEAQRAFLSSHGCHHYQGYYFSRPLPVESFELFAHRSVEETIH
ncbi:EAL domain-containing protein [Telmatospirillum siberiense]|uniref:GGDEF domain-containing protein n=1 Tax=Telmatospirillum siberiense TaxID=382514 RepID=A0A2N3PQ50_9PROT|nr:EAL domain-containing protein [Telmatospirillum siberiense]PKU22524.1 GGDEF domain-containing protein [Telmatospirillum siberiense]